MSSEINTEEGNLTSAILWMFFLSILLFWIPVFGPLIAGVVGGKRAGDVGTAILAVFLPGILVGVAAFAFASVLSGVPVVGIMAGLGGMSLALVNIGPLLLGAIIGGVLSK